MMVSDVIRTVEGTFDGQNMRGEDGKTYPVPANYCSKSKLVEGDRLKLYLQKDGSMMFKQINPVARKSMMGVVTLELNVMAGGMVYRVLQASMTFFNAEPGDEAIIIVPASGIATWAALDNIIKISQ